MEKGTINSATRHPECNAVIGQLWHGVAEARMALHILRVESKANISDGPSRGDLSGMMSLNAREVPAVMPDWLLDPWAQAQPGFADGVGADIDS